MMKHTTTLLLFACLLLVWTANAQNDIPCATDLLHQQALQNPVYFQKHQVLENEAYDFFLGRQRLADSNQAERGSQVLTIPVVVHIIHDNGPENISDAAVQQAISWLNQAFSNQDYYDQGSGADAGIQFCLAQRTPDGQATNGITRDQNALTEFNVEPQQSAMKNINRWKPKNYINIWVVRDMCSISYGCGLVAYAYQPAFHGTNLDGIVVESQLLASPANVSGLAHEMGHYFGLYHTFQGGCMNNDCLLNGDKVCDTPPDQSTAAVPCNQAVNTCSTDAQSGFAGDQPDMTQNHMDYGHLDCHHDFTPGQADRMNFFLNGARKSLLDSKGCLPPCPFPTLAAFTPGDTTINAGQTIFFDNTSQNAINFSWTLNGVPFSSQQNATYLFDSAGILTVQLIAQPLDAQLCEVSSAQVTVQVLCPVVADFTLSDLTPEEGQTIFITNNSQNASQFEWFVNGVSQGVTLDTIVFTVPGSYQIRLVVNDGTCKSGVAQEVFVKDSCTTNTFIFRHAFNSGINWNIQSQTVLVDGNLLIAGVINLGQSDDDSTGVFIAKIKPDGSVFWIKLVGEISDNLSSCPAVAALPDGGFVAFFRQDGQNSLAKFSPDGMIIWLKQTGSLSPYDLVVNPDGDIFMDTRAKFDPNGNLLWSKNQQGFSVRRTALSPEGGLIAINAQPILFRRLARFDTDGNLIWNKKIDNTNATFLDVAVGPDSNIFILGIITLSGIDYTALIKLTPDGEVIWSRRYIRDETSWFVPKSFVVTDKGLTVIAYLTVKTTPVTLKHYRTILHMDFDGNILWARHFNDSYYSEAKLSATSDGYFGTSSTANEIAWYKADSLGYAGECQGDTYEIIYKNLSGVSSIQPINILPGPTDFPPDSLMIVDTEITFDTFCAPTCPREVEHCNNNLDDDGDGLFDCLDPDCNCPEDVCKPGQANIWYFGDHSGLDFNTEPPTVLTDGQTMNALGSAVMCDAQGNLLFYSDGKTVFNRFHEPMPNGDSLSIISQTLAYESIALPHPGEAGLYYLFLATNEGLWYFLINMKMEEGRGDIWSSGQVEPLIEFRLTAIQSCTFNGYWLVVKTHIQDFASYFNAYRIDENGLDLNAVYSSSEINSIFPFGQMKFSPDGRKLAKATGHFGPIELYDFDVSSGVISNEMKLELPFSGRPYGLEFSPNGRFLYISMHEPANLTTKLIQLDLEVGTPDQIVASFKEVASKSFISSSAYVYGALQLAPNGKIYVTDHNNLDSSTTFLHVIHRPDLTAPACQFQENGLVLTGTPGANGGLVNVVQNIFVQPAIAFPKNTPDPICTLDSTYNYVTEKTGCFSYDSIVWTLQGIPGTLQPNGETATITYSDPGEGQLIATAYSPCGIVADTLHIVVTEPFDKTLDLGPDRTVCDNGVFTFNAGSGFARYRWQNGAPDSVLTTLLPGQYWVEVWDACGNRQTDTVSVSIAPATVLDLGDDQEGCDDLTATFQRPEFFSRWLWTPDDFISCDTCASVTATPAATTSWIVVAQTDDGCISVDTVTFQVRDTLFFQLDTSVCFGQTIDLFGVSLPADTTAQFFFPASGPGCDTLLTVNVLGLDAPMSELDAMVCSGQLFDFNGALLPADTTATFLFPGAGSACDSVVVVNVSAYPDLTVTLPPDTTLRVGATLVLKAETSGTGVLNFAWSPAEGLSCADCPDPVATPLETTLYSISVADANGCSAQDSILVTVDPACVVIIPNAFTPNGDGVNDRFYPKTDPCVRTVRVWRVVTRWGEMVFERFNFLPNDPGLGWDGNRANGEPFPSDVLVWYVELEYYDGRKEVRKGDVGLLR